jgi:hypothetical protein
MHITVQLEEATLSRLLDDILPITILLDDAEGLDGRWVRINPARRLELSVDEGIRLVTSGELRWTVGPMPMTLTAHSLAVMLRPVVVGTHEEARLLFRPVLETADLQNVPDLLDRGIVGLVNRALEARSERLAWDFGRMLALRFLLPDTLVPLEAAAVGVEVARLRVGAGVIELTIVLTMHVSRLADERATGHALRS